MQTISHSTRLTSGTSGRFRSGRAVLCLLAALVAALLGCRRPATGACGLARSATAQQNGKVLAPCRTPCKGAPKGIVHNRAADLEPEQGR